jgi:SNF2 family DNA or RNA helicase
MRRNLAEIKHRYAVDLPAFLLAGETPPPVRLFDLEALELVDDPPHRIFSFTDFRVYQRWMSKLIVRLPAVFLAAEMGLGKTAAVLKAIRQLLDVGEIKKVLIVAPLRVADHTWPEEIAKWAFARDLTYIVATGDEDDRRIALRQEADIHIINRENLVWLQQHWGRHWPYDMLVYDEASRLKGGNKRTKGNVRQDGTKSRRRISEFGTLRRMRGFFKKVVLLSGTPAPNGLVDLWGPIFIIDLGQRLGTSKDAFLKRWFVQDRYTYKITPHEWSHDEIMGKLDDVFFSLKEADYLELPPLVPIDHWVDLPPKAMEIYRRMERDMVLEEFDIEAVNNGVLTNKLLQVANGSIYKEDGSAVRIHEAKLDALESIIAEAMGRPVLLGYEFKFDLDAIKKRFPFARIFGDSKNDKKDWDAGRIKLLVTHPASAGHGLNFQFGGNIQVWYGLTWSLELYLQFLKRLHRSGQLADRVFLHRILARRTADESMVRTLGIKGVTQDMITDAVKAHVEEEHWRLAA